jgi:hypothetical protein
MQIQATITVELNHDQETELLVAILKRDYQRVLSDYLHLRRMEQELDTFELEDMKNNADFLNCVESVLQNYIDDSSYISWLKNNGRYDG